MALKKLRDKKDKGMNPNFNWEWGAYTNINNRPVMNYWYEEKSKWNQIINHLRSPAGSQKKS